MIVIHQQLTVQNREEFFSRFAFNSIIFILKLWVQLNYKKIIGYPKLAYINFVFFELGPMYNILFLYTENVTAPKENDRLVLMMTFTILYQSTFQAYLSSTILHEHVNVAFFSHSEKLRLLMFSGNKCSKGIYLTREVVLEIKTKGMFHPSIIT